MFKLWPLLTPTLFMITSVGFAQHEKSGELFEVREKEIDFYIDEIKWSHFKVDECNMYNSAVANEDKLRLLGLRRCRDNSISFKQPKSRGIGGWEGKCGQTFGANTIYSLCRLGVNPDSYFKRYFRDITPGVRPGTLKKGMSKITNKLTPDCFVGNQEWRTYAPKNAKKFIDTIENLLTTNYSLPSQITLTRRGEKFYRNPVGALVLNPGGRYLHWVSIVDIERTRNSCFLYVNHWDNQYKVPCSTFSNWSKNVGEAYSLFLKSYSLIAYN